MTPVTPHRRSARTLSLLLAVTVVVAGCSGGSSGVNEETEQRIATLEQRVTDLEQELAAVRQRIVAPTAAAWSMRSDDSVAEAIAYLESEQVAAVVGATLSDASCDAPTSPGQGGVLTCVATAADGTVWDLEIEITGNHELTLQDGAPQG